MASSALKQLKSKDPKERMAAIKAVAKALDAESLKLLAKMAGDDPDPAVKDMAQKAGAYIFKHTRPSTTPDEPEADSPKKGKSTIIPVDTRKKEQALRMINAAFHATQQGQNAQAASLLAKAVILDPNHKSDSYFISLCEAATGLQDKEALAAIHDTTKVEARSREEVQSKAQKSLDDHASTIGKMTWRDALIEIGLTALIAVIGTVLVLFVASSTAQAYHNSYETNQEDVALAIAENRIYVKDGKPVFEEGYPLYLVADQAPPGIGEEPETFSDMLRVYNETTPYWAINEYWREFGLGKMLLAGIIAGGTMAVALLVMAFVTHLLAQMLGGKGRLPHTSTVITSLMMNRTVLFAALAFVSALMYFNGGSNATLFLAVMGLFIGLNALILALRVGKAYRVNPAVGVIAGLAGIGAAGALAAGMIFIAPL